MTKRISTKYAFLIMAVITSITLVFVPVYMYVQESMFINLEINSMASFCDDIVGNVSFSDDDEIESYLEDNNDKSYTVTIYNSSKERVFTTQRWGKKQSNNNNEQPKIPERNIAKYSVDSRPVYSEKDEAGNKNISLRKIVSSSGSKYYIFLRENLKNDEAIFSYTNNVLVIILVLYILVCGVFLFLLMKSLTKSIRTLNSAVKKIAQKDYSVRYKGKFPSDEVGTLAGNFNDMADTIQDNINSIKNYNFLLKEDIDRLKEYENMRSKFVRNTTHELKTPLAIISSQVEMMSCTEDEEKRKYYFESAMEEIQKMSSLITSFLKYSVEEKETFKTKSEELNLSYKIKELCDKISGTMQSKKLNFECDIEEGLTLEIAENHVEHIFNNYIMNAMKHTSKGGGIMVTLKSGEIGYRLSVYNDGEKIPENQLDKIWTEFYSENKKSTDNVGLGLFIVKEVSVINNMDCGVLNRENGVEFWFDFVLK